jgi:hypothetical protein
MQGYADPDLPSQPVSHIAALVVAPLPLNQALQSSLANEATKRHLALDDALTIFPPTRQYTDAQIKRELADRGIDAVLVVNVGDTGVMQQYVGTLLSGGSSGSVSGFGTVNSFGGMSTVSYSGTTSGSSYGFASPVYHSTRQTTFSAKLIDPVTGRNLWIGNGEIKASGTLFIGDAISSSKSAAAIFGDLQAKGIVPSPS